MHQQQGCLINENRNVSGKRKVAHGDMNPQTGKMSSRSDNYVVNVFYTTKIP